MEETLKRYYNYRMLGDHESLLNLCTEDITVVSERDGTHTGQNEVRAYLQKVKPQSTMTWGETRRLSETRLGVQGTVRVFFIDVNVVGFYDFDSKSGKIRRIEVGRGSLPLQ